MGPWNRRLSRPRCAVVPVLAVVGLLLGVSAAPAADYVVTKLEDTNDGSCDVDCSLREAIISANATAGPDTILLSVGTYQLSIPGIDEDLCATGDLDLLDDVSIKGLGRARNGATYTLPHLLAVSLVVRRPRRACRCVA